MIRRCLLLLLAALLSACGTDPRPPVTVTTSGTAEVAVAPTRARISITTETHASTPTQAADRNDAKAKTLLYALKADPRLDSVRVVSVNVAPIKNDAGLVVGYAAVTDFDFLTRALDSIGPLLNQALTAGATAIAQVSFEADSADAGYQQALDLAFRRARTQALALSSSSGHALGSLVSVSTAGPWGRAVSAFADVSIGDDLSAATLGVPHPSRVRVGPTPRAITVYAEVSARWSLVAK